MLAVDDSEETRVCYAHLPEAYGLQGEVVSNGAEAIIFMVLGADWNAIEAEALSVGIIRCLQKPLFPSTLISMINKYLDTDSANSETHCQAEEAKLDFNGSTILIAKDIEVNREIVAAVLEETGITIDFAENGRFSVDAFSENPNKYDLILMDIQMPEMNGYEATKAIRALEPERAGTIPIIAMTANVFKEDIEACIACGMNDHLGKPIDPTDLFEKIRKYSG